MGLIAMLSFVALALFSQPVYATHALEDESISEQSIYIEGILIGYYQKTWTRAYTNDDHTDIIGHSGNHHIKTINIWYRFEKDRHPDYVWCYWDNLLKEYVWQRSDLDVVDYGYGGLIIWNDVWTQSGVTFYPEVC